MGQRGEKTESEGQKGRQPRIRLNSSKVSQLAESDDQLVDIAESSRFSQWRKSHRVSRTEEVEKPGTLEVASPVRPLEKAGPARGLKALPTWKKWAYGLGAFLGTVLLFVGLVFFSPLLAARTITVEGASLLDEMTVHNQLRVLEGTPMTRITETQVAELIGNENVLYGVTLEARPPHDLVVRLHERVPVAVVEHEGIYVLVDNEGVQLGRAASVEDAGVPLVAGGLDILSSDEFRTVTGVLAALPTSNLAQVSEAKADSASTITLEMLDGTQVVWGTPEDSELKAKVLVQLMESVGSETVVETYDVSSPLVPTVK